MDYERKVKKIICKYSPLKSDNTPYFYFTVGKEYLAIEDYTDMYYVFDDLGEKQRFHGLSKIFDIQS